MLNFLSPTSGEQQIHFDNFKITAVLEPATAALWAAVTLVGFGAVRRAVRVRR